MQAAKPQVKVKLLRGVKRKARAPCEATLGLWLWVWYRGAFAVPGIVECPSVGAERGGSQPARQIALLRHF